MNALDPGRHQKCS